VRQFNNFFGGDVRARGIVFPNDDVARGYPDSYAKLHTYHDILCGTGRDECTPWTPAGFGDDPASVNDQEEKTRAFYTQLRFGFDDWRFPVDGNIGMRYVKTKSTARRLHDLQPEHPDLRGAPHRRAPDPDHRRFRAPSATTRTTTTTSCPA
jgi:iron complex outermembrane receptor protein